MNSLWGKLSSYLHSSLIRVLLWAAVIGWVVISVLFVLGISVFRGVKNSADSARSIAVLTSVTPSEASAILADYDSDLVNLCSDEIVVANFQIEASAPPRDYDPEEIVITGMRAPASVDAVGELLGSLNPGSQIAAVGGQYAAQEASRYTASYSANLAIASFFNVSLKNPALEFNDEFVDQWEVSLVPTCILMERFSGTDELSRASTILFRIDLSPDRQSIRFRPIHVELNRAQAKSSDSLVQLQITNGITYFEYDDYEEIYSQSEEKVDVLEFDLRLGEAWTVTNWDQNILNAVLSRRIVGESDWILIPQINKRVMDQCVANRRNCEFGSVRLRTTIIETGEGESFYSRIEQLLR